MKHQILNYISLWKNRCYSEGIPEEAPIEIDEMVPSYKRIVAAIFKNNLKHIGIESEKTEWYGILKCIELGKQYKKRKTMTQQETKEFIMQLTTTLIQKKCYIKGFGNLMRVCDESHSPVKNITRQQFETLVVNKIVRREGLIYVLDVAANPFKHYLEVKLPIKV